MEDAYVLHTDPVMNSGGGSLCVISAAVVFIMCHISMVSIYFTLTTHRQTYISCVRYPYVVLAVVCVVEAERLVSVFPSC